MKTIARLPWFSPSLLLAAGLVACSAPAGPESEPQAQLEELEDCAASSEWLPRTPPLQMFDPLPHPSTECPFYRGAWHTFLLALEPQQDASGTPALLDPRRFPTIADTFTSRVAHPANRAYLGDIKQAGRREILIDSNGNSIFYAIHVNDEFRDFIVASDLQTSDKLQAYPVTHPNLFFPAGVSEFKSAWQIVEGDAATIAAETADYISIQTTVPTLSQVDGKIIEDKDNPRPVTARLLAIHAVFTLPGHPEFIWGSIEHSMGTPDSAAADLKRNVAPTLDGENPMPGDPNNNHIASSPVTLDDHYLLYRGGTLVGDSNLALPEAQLHLDPVTQKFVDPISGLPQSSSIYRMFPASKSHTIEPDQAITSLNNNVEQLFAAKAGSLHPRDKRGHYRLVGAQWMDKPEYFKNDFPISNEAVDNPFVQQGQISASDFDAEIGREGADSPWSILAGEDRMSSTTMESFTQAPGAFQNCFSCHNTRAITANGVALNDNREGVQLLAPGLLNVSHVLSQFILEDCGSYLQPGNLAGPSGHTAVCPPFVPPTP